MRIKVSMSNGQVNGTIEKIVVIDDKHLEGLTQEEINESCDEAALEAFWNRHTLDWKVAE